MSAEAFEIRWRCRAGVVIKPQSGQAVEVTVDEDAPVQIAMPKGAPQPLAQINAGVSEEALATLAGENVALIAVLLRFLAQLRSRGLLEVDLCGAGRCLATARPLVADFDLSAARPPDHAGPRRLSRFALLRRQDNQWLLESGATKCDVLIHDPVVIGWLHDVATRAPVPDSLEFQMLDALARMGFIDDESEEPSARCTWEFHDRLFHVRSRAFGSLRPFADTYRFGSPSADGTLPPPAIRPGFPGMVIDLPVPDMQASRPLAEVMERRRSCKRMGGPPVDLPRVAALLYRTVRVTGSVPGGYLLRPYPAAGALHELEIYLAVRECRDLDPGFYHYRTEAHALSRLAGANAAPATAAMIADCAWSWAQPDEPPQCLIVISSRFPRLAWKYEAIAYRLSLMSAGVLLHGLQLVASDLGLNGCASGTGNPALFAQATGESTWNETSIAEFGFGSGAEPAAKPSPTIPTADFREQQP